MNIVIDPNGIWYHGSDVEFAELRAGSTITQWRALAEAFSHRPEMLCCEEDGSIIHNGTKHGYLYAIDEAIIVGEDCYQHPRSTMDINAEFLTARPLKVRLIGEVPIQPEMKAAFEGLLKRYFGK